MIERPIQRTERLLEILREADVEFVIVGGVAALAHGGATMTKDLDVAAPFSRENLLRLLKALTPHRPVHATRPELSLLNEPLERLLEFRLLLIETSLGRLDVLSEVQPLGPFDDLRYVELEILPGAPLRVLDLDQLIEVKAYLRRPKDRIVEQELRALRDRLRHES